MRIDSQLLFVPLSGLSLVGAAGVTIASQVIDLLGVGVGVAPPNIIGQATLFGTEMGIGAGFAVPQLMVSVGTAFTTSTSATLNVKWQFAVDLGTPTYQPGTWNTMAETGGMAVANLTANAVIARLDFPLEFPASNRPRYTRLLFDPGTGADFTAGTIAFAGITLARDDQSNKYATNNFVVS